MAMTDDEFGAFVARCVEQLERKQADLRERFGLGSHARWSFDQATGPLRFMDSAGVVKIEADATDVGSFSTTGHSWRWGWANQSVVDSQKARSSELRGLYDLTGIDVFHREVFEAEEGMTWERVAMAVERLDALGCYRGAVKQLHVFQAIDEIRVVEPHTADIRSSVTAAFRLAEARTRRPLEGHRP
jgi:hypothetical protein